MDRHFNTFCYHLLILIVTATLISLPAGCAGKPSRAGVPLTEGPRAIFPKPVFIFGTVMDGDIINHTYVVHNLGGAPLTIEAIKPNCTCITATKPAPIPSGGQDSIQVTLDTKERGGHEILKKIEIVSNDLNQPEFTLTMGGKIEPYAQITPPEARMIGRLDETVTQRLRIRPHPEHPFVIKNIHPQFGNDIQWEIVPAGEPVEKEGYLLTVTSTLTEPGRIIDILFLETDLPDSRELKIMIRGEVQKEKTKNGDTLAQ